MGIAEFRYEVWILPSPPAPLPSLGEGSQSRRRRRGEGGVRAGHTPIQQRQIMKLWTGLETARSTAEDAIHVLEVFEDFASTQDHAGERIVGNVSHNASLMAD
jgi:alkylation response protein AidB-like acyl-CoA dehydrogenase